MKKFFVTLFTFVLSTIVLTDVVRGDDVNILFIGNSFTFRHDLPELVQTVISEGKPGLSVNVKAVTYGGQDLFRHYELFRSQTVLRTPSITIGEIQEHVEAIQALAELEQPPESYHAYWKNAGLKEAPWEHTRKYVNAALRNIRPLTWKLKHHVNRTHWDYVVLQSWRDIVPDVGQGYALYAQQFAGVAVEENTRVILYLPASAQ